MMADSNIVIYATLPDFGQLRKFVQRSVSSVSIITYVEVLGFHGLTADDRALLHALFSNLSILPITHPVAETAVRLRQQRRMQLGDSLIAATALVYNKTLVTHNTKDFAWIETLELLDPLR